jgi:hypothetical protein
MFFYILVVLVIGFIVLAFIGDRVIPDGDF